MWKDIIKVQVSQTRQKLRMGSSKLPDDEEPPDWFEKIDNVVRGIQYFNTLIDPQCNYSIWLRI